METNTNEAPNWFSRTTEYAVFYIQNVTKKSIFFLELKSLERKSYYVLHWSALLVFWSLQLLLYL
jgi:hypothetical protein